MFKTYLNFLLDKQECALTRQVVQCSLTQQPVSGFVVDMSSRAVCVDDRISCNERTLCPETLNYRLFVRKEAVVKTHQVSVSPSAKPLEITACSGSIRETFPLVEKRLDSGTYLDVLR